MIGFLVVTIYILALSLFSFFNEEEFYGNTFYFCIFIFFISGIVYQVLLDLYSESKHRIGLHLRIVIFWVLLMTGLCSLLKQIYAPYYLIPGLIVEFLIISVLNKVLYFQEKFLNQTKDWPDQDLPKNLRNNSLIVETLNKSIDLNKKLLLTISIFIAFATVIGGLKVNFQEDTFTIILIIVAEILFYTCVLFLVLIYNVYQRNTYFYFLGFKTAINSKASIIKSVLLITLLSAFIGIGLSSTHISVKLPVNEIQETIRESQGLPPPPQMKIPEVKLDPKELEEVLGVTKENKFLKVFFTILEYALILGVIVLISFLLVKFIFTTSFFAFFKGDNLSRIFKEFFQKIEDFILNLFHFKKQPKQKYATVNSKSFKFQIDNFIKKSKKSSAKKQELDRLTKQFMHIIEWGDQKGIKYKNTMAPGEYMSLINHEAASKIGYLYEKALYAEELLSASEENEFFKLSQQVLES